MSYASVSKADVEAQELVEDLIRVTENRQFDPLTLGRLDKRAKMLIKRHPQAAHMCLGAVSALRFDVRKTKDHFRISFQHPGLDLTTVRFNYAVALQHVEDLQGAYEAIQVALEDNPGGPDYLDMAIRRAVDVGCFQASADYAERYDAALPSEEPHHLGEVVRQVVEAQNEGAFTQEGVSKLLEIGAKVQQTHQVHRELASLSPDGDDQNSFSMRKVVWTTPKQAAEMNEELADAWAGDKSLMNDPGFKFTLSFVGKDTTGASNL